MGFFCRLTGEIATMCCICSLLSFFQLTGDETVLEETDRGDDERESNQNVPQTQIGFVGDKRQRLLGCFGTADSLMFLP